MRDSREFDVIIIGTGIAGTLLSLVVQRHGARVLLVDDHTHPRFAIGESTAPHASMLTRILAARYDVPEIANCFFSEVVKKKVSTNGGQKRNFGFIYHRPGEENRPGEVVQSVFSNLPYGTEQHLFRQDIDSYLFYSCVRHGARVRQKTKVTSIETDANGVSVKTSEGEEFWGKYLVDATGYRSVLADRYSLRIDPCPMRTHSRSLFTHMVGVKGYEECSRWGKGHPVPTPWSHGTLHHIFDRGWLWVIPFNNRPDSTNPLVSIGLNVDDRVFPKPGAPPEEDFYGILSRFPSVMEQLADARAVREWTRTDRVQYTATHGIGPRWCLMSHAYGFVDPLFSRGLVNTVEVISALGWRILRSLRDGDWSHERYEYVDRLQQALFDYNDRLVNCSYISWTDFPLWRAWYRIWALGSLLGGFRFNSAYGRFLDSGDPTYLGMEDPPHMGLLCPDYTPYHELFVRSATDVEAVREGSLSPSEATSRLEDRLERSEFARPLLESGFFVYKDEDFRPVSNWNLRALWRIYRWTRTGAPREIRERYFDVGAGPMLRSTWSYLRGRAPTPRTNPRPESYPWVSNVTVAASHAPEPTPVTA